MRRSGRVAEPGAERTPQRGGVQILRGGQGPGDAAVGPSATSPHRCADNHRPPRPRTSPGQARSDHPGPPGIASSPKLVRGAKQGAVCATAPRREFSGRPRPNRRHRHRGRRRRQAKPRSAASAGLRRVGTPQIGGSPAELTGQRQVSCHAVPGFSGHRLQLLAVNTRRQMPRVLPDPASEQERRKGALPTTRRAARSARYSAAATIGHRHAMDERLNGRAGDIRQSGVVEGGPAEARPPALTAYVLERTPTNVKSSHLQRPPRQASGIPSLWSPNSNRNA